MDALNITLSLSLANVNLIINALAQMPYLQVRQVIDEITQQAQPQVTAAEAAKPVQAPEPTPAVEAQAA